MEKALRRIRARHERTARLEEAGLIENEFERTEERLRDTETLALVADPLYVAIRSLDGIARMREYFEGYVRDIRLGPNDYPSHARDDPTAYAASEILFALGSFGAGTLERWRAAIPELQDRQTYLMTQKSFAEAMRKFS